MPSPRPCGDRYAAVVLRPQITPVTRRSPGGRMSRTTALLLATALTALIGDPQPGSTCQLSAVTGLVSCAIALTGAAVAALSEGRHVLMLFTTDHPAGAARVRIEAPR